MLIDVSVNTSRRTPWVAKSQTEDALAKQIGHAVADLGRVTRIGDDLGQRRAQTQPIIDRFEQQRTF